MMIYVCVWILGFVQSEKCYKGLSNGASGSWFCCNNHEEKSGECVECDIGYISKDGFPCKPCSLGLWGRRCRDICSCQHNERCDIVYGCVDGKTVISEKWEATDTTESTHVLTTPNSLKNDVVFLKDEIVIYSICVGSIAAIFALASRCLKNKRKVDNLNKSRYRRTQHSQVSSDRTNVQFDNESNAYDSIEEDKLKCDRRSEHTNDVENIFSTISDLDVNSSSYIERDPTDLSKEEYSSECQSMTEVDLYGNCHSVDESTQNTRELSSKRCTKSLVDEPKRNNGSGIYLVHKFPSL